MLYGVPLVFFTVQVCRQPEPSHLSPVRFSARRVSAILVVLTCFLMVPDLSDDYHRYLWEGHAGNHQFSPYIHSPSSLFEQLEHPSEPFVNHAELTAIYPPLAQFFFRVADHLPFPVYAWKTILFLSVLPLCLGSLAHKPFQLVSPLILFEGIWNAHLDLLGILPSLYLVKSLQNQKAIQASLALAVLTSLKLVPIVLLPLCFLHLQRKKVFLAAFALFMLLIYAPFLAEWEHLFKSFFIFSRSWYFNNPLFHLLKTFVGQDQARLLLMGGLGVSYLWILFSKQAIHAKCAWIWIAMMTTSPTVYPWYLLWVLPFLSSAAMPFLHLGYAATFLSYLVLIPYRQSGVWSESYLWMIPEWIRLLFCFYKITKLNQTHHSL